LHPGIENTVKKSTGKIILENANVEWDFEFIAKEKEEIQVSRVFSINDYQLELGRYAKDLHSVAYQEILKGKGINLESVKEGVKLLDTAFTF